MQYASPDGAAAAAPSRRRRVRAKEKRKNSRRRKPLRLKGGGGYLLPSPPPPADDQRQRRRSLDVTEPPGGEGGARTRGGRPPPALSARAHAFCFFTSVASAGCPSVARPTNTEPAAKVRGAASGWVGGGGTKTACATAYEAVAQSDKFARRVTFDLATRPPPPSSPTTPVDHEEVHPAGRGSHRCAPQTLRSVPMCFFLEKD